MGIFAFFGQEGKGAEYAFVGLNQSGNIATYHIKNASALWKVLGRTGVI